MKRQRLQSEIVQEIGSTDTLTQALIDRLINKVYIFSGERIEIEYVTQDFLGTEEPGKEANIVLNSYRQLCGYPEILKKVVNFLS